MAKGYERQTTGKHIGTFVVSNNIYINDLPDGITSTIYMYADDTKLYCEIYTSPNDHQIIQNDLSKLCTWSKK